MTAKKWIPVITENCKILGTYRPQFDTVISALADVLERKDEALEAYKNDDTGPVTVFSSGNTGTNSYLKVWMELNSQAMKMWSELGLTPAGLKKINEELMKPKKRSALADALEKASR